MNAETQNTIEAYSLREHLERIEELVALSTKEVLNTKEAARLLDVSEGRLLHLTSQREIPHYKKGSRNYFKKSELESYLCQTRVPTNDEIDATAATYIAVKKHTSSKRLGLR